MTDDTFWETERTCEQFEPDLMVSTVAVPFTDEMDVNVFRGEH